MATTKGKCSRKVLNKFKESAVQQKVSGPGPKSEPSELIASNIHSYRFKPDKELER